MNSEFAAVKKGTTTERVRLSTVGRKTRNHGKFFEESSCGDRRQGCSSEKRLTTA